MEEDIINEVREHIAAAEQKLEALASRELALVKTKLNEARLWLQEHVEKSAS
jgi:hypothetical protein